MVQALGAWIYCFRKPVTETDVHVVEETMKAIREVVERHMAYDWDGVCLAVAMKQSVVPGLEKSGSEWEDSCREHGFEFVDGEGQGRNEFGEAVGMERIREALEANEWTSLDDADDFGPFAAEEAEINLEWLGVKNVISGEEEEQVEELEQMARKLLAIKGEQTFE